MKKYHMSYAHLNGKIVITPYRLKGKDKSLFARTNYTLDPLSIKRIDPVIERNDIGSKSTKSKLRNLQLTAYYLPVEVGQFITIPLGEDTKDVAGTYQVTTKRTSLSTVLSGDWSVSLIVKEVP